MRKFLAVHSWLKNPLRQISLIFLMQRNGDRRQGGRSCATARPAVTERSGSSTKGRTLFCCETKYCHNLRAFWKAFIGLSTKVIVLSESFQLNSMFEGTKNCLFSLHCKKRCFCCKNLQIRALQKLLGILLRSPKASQPLPHCVKKQVFTWPELTAVYYYYKFSWGGVLIPLDSTFF